MISVDCEKALPHYAQALDEVRWARNACDEITLWQINQKRCARGGWVRFDWKLVRGVLTPQEIAVYVGLCSHVNDETGRLDPGVRLLSKELCMRPASVIKALDGLEKRGIISVLKRGGHKSSAYALHDIYTGENGDDE